MISIEANIEFIEETKNCVDYLQDLGLTGFNFSVAESNAFVFPEWISRTNMVRYLESQTAPLFWGDLYARVV